MKPVHSEEKKQFKKLFQQEHVDRFEDRFKVLQVFLETEHHVTAAEVHQMLKGQGVALDLNFVRETLKFMCRFGFARRNRFDNGEQRYEHLHLGQHHDHMICTKCKKIIEFKDNQLEMLQSRVAQSFGFHMLQHKMEIYGICAECLRQRVPVMPLSVAKQGEQLVIKEISGGPTARLRLLSMGLRVGDRLEVITNNGQGQIVVAVDFTRYVLGRGMAQKVLVSPPHTTEEPDTRAASDHTIAKIEHPMRLSELREKQRAVIRRVGGNGNLRRRILEMGIIKGTEVYVEKYAPLKDPLELIVKGYHISLRVEEAARIDVELLS